MNMKLLNERFFGGKAFERVLKLAEAVERAFLQSVKRNKCIVSRRYRAFPSK